MGGRGSDVDVDVVMCEDLLFGVFGCYEQCMMGHGMGVICGILELELD